MDSKNLRPLGQILLDIEPYLLEMADHDLQWGDYYGLLRSYLEIHLPDQQETYYDDTNPEFFYGHKEKLLEIAKKLK